MKGLFVTGTDTGVGKTFVAAALTRLLCAQNQRVFAFKPIETGCELHNGQRKGADQELLAEAAGNWQQGPLRGLYQLRAPVAPLVAARAEDIVISLDLVSNTAHEGSLQADFTLVEGAGGWRVPITEDADMASLAQRLALPVLLVARATLGTINHTLLTIEAIEKDNCTVAGLVLSLQPGQSLDLALSNEQEIRRRWPGPVRLLSTDPLSLSDLLPA
ncbi:MAG: bioD [Myxococcales bacterium]|nr:bioD [Myxococcales bacterium]